MGFDKWIKVFVVFVIIALGNYGCSTDQSGRYVPIGSDGKMMLDTHTGQVWRLERIVKVDKPTPGEALTCDQYREAYPEQTQGMTDFELTRALYDKFGKPKGKTFEEFSKNFLSNAHTNVTFVWKPHTLPPSK